MRRGRCVEVCVLGISLSLVALLVSCGGTSTTATTNTTPQAVTVTMGTAPSSLTVGQSYTFTAQVGNTTNTAVNWSVNGTAGGNSTVGTISSAGVYVAPALVPNPQNVTIAATSQADNTKSASANVAINISLSVGAAGSGATSSSLQAGGTQQFTVTIQGTTNTAVTWAVNGVVGGNSSIGTITNGDAGLYTAPITPPSPNTVTITATSAAYNSISASFSLTIVPPPITVTVNPTALDLQVNHTVQFSDMVTTTGASQISTAVTWGVKSQGNPGVALYGAITPAGLYTAPASVPAGALNPIPIYVTSQEAPSKFAVAYVTVTAAAVPLQISTTTLAGGLVNAPYSATIAAFGGAQPYAFNVSGGSLPAGLTLNSSTGVISGTPTVGGTANFTVMATDQTSPTHETATANLSIAIIPLLSISTTALSNGAVGAAYSSTLMATGGVSPYTWSVTSGTLPSGLSLNAATGAITGTPGTVASVTTYALTFKVTDSGTPQQTQTLTTSITIYTGLTITTTALPNGVIGTAYSQSVTALGGSTPYTYSISVGSLPASLTLNASSGLISGTPTAAGSSTFTVQIRDSSSPVQIKAQSFTVTVYTALSFPAVTPPNGVVNAAYSTTVSASGGTTPYTWRVTTGTLPAGLSLNSSTGAISGTPTTSGASTFTVSVTDASVPAQTHSQSLTITINTGLSITSTTLPNGVMGAAIISSRTTLSVLS